MKNKKIWLISLLCFLLLVLFFVWPKLKTRTNFDIKHQEIEDLRHSRILEKVLKVGNSVPLLLFPTPQEK